MRFMLQRKFSVDFTQLLRSLEIPLSQVNSLTELMLSRGNSSDANPKV